MKRLSWALVDWLSRTLEPSEREAVRGDLEESAVSGGRALLEMIGLIARRQAAFWRTARPWLAALGLLGPMLVCLGHRSAGETWLNGVDLQFATLWSHGVRCETGLSVADDSLWLVSVSVLLIFWAWSGGLVLGLLTRRAAWFHPGLLVPLLFFKPYHAPLLPAAVLIVLPFLSGIRRGVSLRIVETRRALLVAAAAMAITFIVQMEDGRQALALAAWSRGDSFGGGLAWTPNVLPFAAIFWQLGFMLMVWRTGSQISSQENRT